MVPSLGCRYLKWKAVVQFFTEKQLYSFWHGVSATYTNTLTALSYLDKRCRKQTLTNSYEKVITLIKVRNKPSLNLCLSGTKPGSKPAGPNQLAGNPSHAVSTFRIHTCKSGTVRGYNIPQLPLFCLLGLLKQMVKTSHVDLAGNLITKARINIAKNGN